MKVILKIFLYPIVLVLLLLIVLRVTHHGYLVKGMWATYVHGYSSANIDDAQYFKIRVLPKSKTPSPWGIHEQYNKISISDRLRGSLEQTGTVAFLMTENDQIVYEEYWDDYSETSLTNSFSMAKSVITMLTEIAIEKEIIENWQVKVKRYLPDLSGPHASELELWHLSTMSAGMDWDEHYKNPLGVTAKAYYGNNIKRLMLSLPIIQKPGEAFKYQSGAPQLLALVLMEATGMSISELASLWLCEPLGFEQDALWHLDHRDGTELAYCCMNSNARDFVRFGKLMKNKGNWNGEQIIDSAFVNRAVSGQLAPHYGYAFWLDEIDGHQIFYQRGILGQYIITIPDLNVNIVRLGHQRGPKVDAHSEDFKVIVEEVLSQFQS